MGHLILVNRAEKLWE